MESQNSNKNFSHYCQCCGKIYYPSNEAKESIQHVEKTEPPKKVHWDENFVKKEPVKDQTKTTEERKEHQPVEEERTKEETKTEIHKTEAKCVCAPKNVTLCSPKKSGPPGNERYVIKNMIKLYASSDLFRPFEPPRQTQTTVAKYLVRADGHDLEYTDRDLKAPEATVRKWVQDNRESWVPRPEEGGVQVLDVFNKYGSRYDFNPINYPTKQLFPRPYSLEIDCLNEYRQLGVDKCKVRNLYSCKELKKRVDTGQKGKFKFERPFWWLGDEAAKSAGPKVVVCTRKKEDEEADKKSYKLRWRPAADLSTRQVERDWCERRLLMAKTGARFKHEACNFYYKHYPSPTCSLTKIKFSI